MLLPPNQKCKKDYHNENKPPQLQIIQVGFQQIKNLAQYLGQPEEMIENMHSRTIYQIYIHEVISQIKIK